jgi:hypothetical protein
MVKEKHLNNNIYISNVLSFIAGNNLLVTGNNVQKIRKCYINKQEQQMETLIELNKMFKYSNKITIKINTDDLDKII